MQPGSKINFAELEANVDIAARNYWKNRLEGVETLTCFDFASSTTAADTGYRQYDFTIPQPVVSWMQSVAASAKAKHVLLMASLAVLMHKYSGSTDMVLFTPAYNANNKESDSVVPVRITNIFNAPFKEALLQLKEWMLQDMQFSHYPIQKKLGYLPGANSKSPAVALLVKNIQSEDALNTIHPGIVFNFSGDAVFTISANAIYQPGDIHRLAVTLLGILETISADPSIPIPAINIFYESGFQLLLHQFNYTQGDYPRTKTIIDLFEEQARETPGAIAILYGSVSVSYRQLKDQSDKVAAYLIKKQGIQPGDLVGVLMDRQPLMIAVLLGILKAGAAYIPVEPDYPAARIHAIAADAGWKVLITTAFYRQLKSLEDIAIADLNDIEQYLHQPTEAMPSLATANGLAYVIYTSGSTGKPKGVMIEHRSLLNYIYWAAGYYVRGDADIFPLYTSVSFDLTVTSIYTPLITGNAILVYPGQDGEQLVTKVFYDNVATVIKLTPSHLKIIRDMPGLQWKPGDKPKKLIVGGENLESRLAKAIHDKFDGNIEIYNEYGPTEATVGCMIHRYNPGENFLSVPIGMPNANNRLYIFNRQLQLVPFNVWGELYIAGDGLARGYANNPQLTTEKFIEHPYISNERIYKTGDLARRLENGMLEYAGRIDEQVKIRGYRIELAGIEHELNQHEAIKESAVIVWQKENHQQLLAYYIASMDLETETLQKFLAERLPVYMVPSLFIRLGQFPLTTNGKLDRKALPDPAIALKKQYVPPENEIEERLAEIWAEVLDIHKEEVSTEINFFELGGDSISILKLNDRINMQFQCSIPVTDMFMLPTIKALQKVIKEGVTVLPSTDMISAQEDRESIFINRES